jgi:hypothetical protein
MTLLSDWRTYARFAWELPRFLRHRVTLERSRAIVQQRLAEREGNFLRMVERGIFGHPRSPYLPVLKLAQVELGDIQNMVQDKGLEATLRALREAGVYVAFEEFKGREPIVRHGKVIQVKAREFDNPYLRPHYYAMTGGTTGTGTRVRIELERVAEQVPHVMLNEEAHGLSTLPQAIWFGTLPDHIGTSYVLKRAHFGRMPQRWFSPIRVQGWRSWKYRLATQYILAAAERSGVPIPRPEPLPLDRAAVIARWAADAVAGHGGCVVAGFVSSLVRVSVAAREAGLDLTGTTFLGSGEPPTPAKVEQMRRVGARWVPSYWFTEIGPVGQGCANPVDENDLHLLKDVLALIQAPRLVPGTEWTVDAFYFTALLPSASKIMLNVESDDYGVIETRSCGCLWEKYGFTEHVRQVRSFRKLTGEGVTLVGSEMVRILEEVLPARFGGSPLDYQLLEEEDEDGFTRLSLLVSPKVEIADEAEVIQAVLDALGHGVEANIARAFWSQARTLRVKRVEPTWTTRGKLMPLHLGKRKSQ